MNENKIRGYSERGIMNAIAYTIGKNVQDFKSFIKLAETPLEIEDENNISRFDLYIEHSLSDFGVVDMIAFVYYNNEDNPKAAIFFEAKVKTYQSKTWLRKDFYNSFLIESLENKQYYDGSFSNLYYQLYAKKLFFENRKGNIEVGVEDHLCKKNNKAIKLRKIGKNGVVDKLKVDFNKCDKAYYVAIVPKDKSRGRNTDKFKDQVPNRIKHKNLPFDFIDIHYITWDQIYEMSTKDTKYKELKDVFEYNNGQIY